ncbi:hypothetical protein D9M71_760270 [compost metagenome]
MVAQQRAHGVTQQRGVMAGQRRHHQHGRLREQGFHLGGVVAVALEAQQLAERLFHFRELGDGDDFAVQFQLMDAPFGLFVILAEAVEQLVHRREAIGTRHG